MNYKYYYIVMNGKDQDCNQSLTIHSLSLENFKLGGQYLIFNPIARGKHSTIYYGIDEHTKQERAFKFYNFKELEELKGFKQKEICKRISKHEIEVLEQCQSLNVLSCLDVFQNRDYKVVVSEYCQSSLQQEIDRRVSPQISELRAILILKQILAALRSLHQGARLLQVNLQPSHILVRNGIFKLMDLGLPNVLDEPQHQYALSVPEILKRNSYDSKAEVWSIGVLFHQILFGVLPDSLKDGNQLALLAESPESIFKMKHTTDLVSLSTASFLENCLFLSPQRRMCWNQIEVHPMFNLLSSPKRPLKLNTNNRMSVSKHEKDKDFNSMMSIILPLEEEPGEMTERDLEREMQSFFNEKWNTDIIRRQLEKEIEKQYVKQGKPLQLVKLQNTSIEFLKKKINKDEEVYFQEVKLYYLECLKVEFILNNVIQNLPRGQDRCLVELQNLILSSCFTAMSRLKILQNKKKPDSTYQNLLQNCVSKSTASLYETIRKRWIRAGEDLTKLQDKVSSMLFDRWRMFVAKQKVRKKDKFLSGIETIDFLSSQKIAYTKEYAETSRKEIRKEEDNTLKLSVAFKYLHIYDLIWSIETESAVDERYSSLKTYIDRELLKEFSVLHK